MAYKVVINRKAKDDIDEIYKYYADTKFIIKFQAKYNKVVTVLRLFPLSGEQVFCDSEYRKLMIMRRFVLLYRLDDDIVKIENVFDGRTDYKIKGEK
ncbi:MAG: type II toxin-antitoxin system RelE/ParE family toxin [Candidatus Nomurabacteria bacterium]|jgi:plasmid stabilization system protein ParE|nr:type II toxin-antitoxin system RelE/ParE family toxin [Candidatus Nomurabacteria bacterium]